MQQTNVIEVVGKTSGLAALDAATKALERLRAAGTGLTDSSKIDAAAGSIKNYSQALTQTGGAINSLGRQLEGTRSSIVGAATDVGKLQGQAEVGRSRPVRRPGQPRQRRAGGCGVLGTPVPRGRGPDQDRGTHGGPAARR